MKYEVTDSFLEEKGIQIEDEVMPNGEERFRVKLSDFSGVNITTASDTPSWQNAHFHRSCKELYVVISGKVLIAIKTNDNVDYKYLNKGEELIINPMTEHNVYMFAGSKTIVIKYGNTLEKDWNEAIELDEITKKYHLQ